MSEQVSKQAALVAAGTKAQAPTMGGGAAKTIIITSPDTVTWAQNDTIASPVLVPKGSRFVGAPWVSCADMGTGITLDVGIRDVNGTAIDANGLVAALDVATAAVNAAAASGALLAAGVEYITTEDCYVYATLGGGIPAANAQIRIEVPVIFP